MAEALSVTDPSSYSESDKCKVTSLDWDVVIDFNATTIRGLAHLTVQKLQDNVDSLVLDVRELTIESVTLTDSNKECPFEITNPANVTFGSKLTISLGVVAEKCFKVSIKYATSPNASALQWLRPEQTAGKRQPYLFSQCQAIHARSLFPCQDSPAVKFPYTAKVKAPKEITVLMSAEREGIKACPDDPSQNVTSFNMKVPIPSYLVAIVAGDLESRDIGPRSKVWSEKELVDAAAYEFAETEQMLQTAEQLGGPYVWGIYDLLVLPPSFPYGGMENPCLTFVTPTLLAGDRSLADVIAHEISHSWTGNLVTNGTFQDFWLNEGHTMFLERKIVGRLHGDNLNRVHASEGWTALQETVKSLREAGEEPYTRLVPDLKGIDPDDAFSSVPYEKGFALLYHLEQLLGGPDVFEPFLRAYIQKFKYTSISTQDWKSFLFEYFSSQEDQEKLAAVDWDGWLYGLGMPPFQPDYDGALTLEQPSKVLSERWVSQPDDSLNGFSPEDINSLPSLLVRQFLQFLLDQEQSISLKKVIHIEAVYGFNSIRNSEVRFRWLRLCIKARWTECIPLALTFVTEQGRMKFVRPIYKDLYGWEEARPQAIANFKRVRQEMHSTTAMLVAKDLKVE